ncbi:family 2 glycosyl transferase [Candidatus Magnetoovum chiemensis]|nr:family 2 glycosyl transferase [Candidatus Magnetoovum chiemensis]
MLPISIAIITKNEERNIKEALESASDAREIIIVDDYSKDRTIEICRQFTNKIYLQQWLGFAKQKQLAVDYASEEWVLILDADERLTNELKKEITNTIKQNTDCNGFYIPRKNFFLNKWIKHSGWWPDYTLRLFKKNKAHLQNRQVHEKVIVDGKTEYLKNPLEHYTYRTISEFIQKMDKYSELASKELPTSQKKAALLSMTVKPMFTFSKMYFLRLGFLDGAHGGILAALYSYYTFMKYLKAWENKGKE